MAQSGAPLPDARAFTPTAEPPITLSQWTLKFPGSAGSKPEPEQTGVTDTLWTDNAATKFYSGEVLYTTHFEATALPDGEHLLLQFAPATPVADDQPAEKPGTRAWLEPPIREAAVVFVNGQRAGALWHPPYELDVSRYIHSGENTLELRVYNTAINELAGQPPRDFTALKAKYGNRFQMQDMENLQPVPSGIVGPVRLVYARAQQTSAAVRHTQARSEGQP